MKNLDKLIVSIVYTFVLLTPMFTYAVVNTLTRPEFISVVVALPQPKPVIEIYEFGPDEEITDWFPREEDNYAWTDQDEEEYLWLAAELEMATEYNHEEPNYEDELLCMAKNIYFEARRESLKGQLAVGLVTLNRVNSRYYPNSVCDVVYQHAQFSWYWDGLSDHTPNKAAFEKSILYASALLADGMPISDFTYGSDHYHADYIEPTWKEGNERHDMVYVVQIETHIFYRQELRTRTSL